MIRPHYHLPGKKKMAGVDRDDVLLEFLPAKFRSFFKSGRVFSIAFSESCITSISPGRMPERLALAGLNPGR